MSSHLFWFSPASLLLRWVTYQRLPQTYGIILPHFIRIICFANIFKSFFKHICFRISAHLFGRIGLTNITQIKRVYLFCIIFSLHV